jgi:hypothetical protein
MRKPALSFDLGPDMFVKSQNAFVFQMFNTHKPTPENAFGFRPNLHNGCKLLASTERAQAFISAVQDQSTSKMSILTATPA